MPKNLVGEAERADTMDQFEILLQCLGVTAAHREALLRAATQKLAPKDALELLTSWVARDPTCPYCRSGHVGGWSSIRGLKRFRCKDCRRTFNPFTGTPLAQVHRRAAWLTFVQRIATGESIDEAAIHCKISVGTLHRWRQALPYGSVKTEEK